MLTQLNVSYEQGKHFQKFLEIYTEVSWIKLEQQIKEFLSSTIKQVTSAHSFNILLNCSWNEFVTVWEGGWLLLGANFYLMLSVSFQ